jgi:hypothetical protein
MTRGFRTVISRAALLTAAGLLMGSTVYGPARAADLGNAGGCCGDLEERVAELEATTARKGNRVVSLQIYGQVNKALMIWDDGVDSDAYIVDNTYATSRFGITGKAAIKPGWTAGYLMEFDVADSRSDTVSQGSGGDDLPNNSDSGAIQIRQNNWWIESERLGRLTVGQGSTAADAANEIVLGNSLRNSDVNHGNNFIIQNGTGAVLGTQQVPSSDAVSTRFWAHNLDSGRDDVIRYDSPSIYGFILSAAWGDNDYADLVVRYKGEWNSVRIAGAIAYVWDDTRNPNGSAATSSVTNFEQLSGSISLMHIPTGLYGAFAAGEREFTDNLTFLNAPDSNSFWYLQLGLERKWLPYGTTAFYGEYGEYDDFAFESSRATRVGFGAVQKFDSAAMDLYAQATFWSFDGGDVLRTDPEDFSTVLIGSRIKF